MFDRRREEWRTILRRSAFRGRERRSPIDSSSPFENLQKYIGDDNLQTFLNYCLAYLSEIRLPVKRFVALRECYGLLSLQAIRQSTVSRWLALGRVCVVWWSFAPCVLSVFLRPIVLLSFSFVSLYVSLFLYFSISLCLSVR